MEEQSFFEITDGRTTVRAYYTEGEMALAAIRRTVKFAAPCGGRGVCGQCIIDVQQEDGSLKKELACFYPAQPMTVVMRLVRPLDPKAEESN